MQSTAKTAAPTVDLLIPMAHVVDVDCSTRFYELLGFTVENRMADHFGVAFWAMLSSGQAKLMLARASGPIPAGDQAVLFYLYTQDIRALHHHLLSNGLADGGAFCGGPGNQDGRCVVFEPTAPHYMPAGEFRVHDPDGYCLLIGQRM